MRLSVKSMKYKWISIWPSEPFALVSLCRVTLIHINCFEQRSFPALNWLYCVLSLNVESLKNRWLWLTAYANIKSDRDQITDSAILQLILHHIRENATFKQYLHQANMIMVISIFNTCPSRGICTTGILVKRYRHCSQLCLSVWLVVDNYRKIMSFVKSEETLGLMRMRIQGVIVPITRWLC